VRHHPALCAVDGVVFLFGGLSESDEALGDFWKFEKNQWVEVEYAGEGPPPGYGMHLVAHPGFLLLTGGADEFVFAYFDLANGTWRIVRTPLIPPLAGHRTVLRQGGKGYVIGGIDLAAKAPNHITFYFTQMGASCKCAWTTGMAPTQRTWAVCEILEDYVLVMGGSVQGNPFVFDLKTATWFKPNWPPFFVSRAAVCSNGKEVFVHGGRNEQDAVDTRYMYRVRIKPDGREPKGDLAEALFPEPEEDIWAKDKLQFKRSASGDR
jgi:hypothetical protein